MAELAQCRRCGSHQVAWVKSKRTGRNYLAFARQTSGYTAYGADSATAVRGGVQVYAHQPHKCDDRTRGGFHVCDKCGFAHDPIWVEGAAIVVDGVPIPVCEYWARGRAGLNR